MPLIFWLHRTASPRPMKMVRTTTTRVKITVFFSDGQNGSRAVNSPLKFPSPRNFGEFSPVQLVSDTTREAATGASWKNRTPKITGPTNSQPARFCRLGLTFGRLRVADGPSTAGGDTVGRTAFAIDHTSIPMYF